VEWQRLKEQGLEIGMTKEEKNQRAMKRWNKQIKKHKQSEYAAYLMRESKRRKARDNEKGGRNE
jgi:hypothetical protein